MINNLTVRQYLILKEALYYNKPEIFFVESDIKKLLEDGLLQQATDGSELYRPSDLGCLMLGYIDRLSARIRKIAETPEDEKKEKADDNKWPEKVENKL